MTVVPLTIDRSFQPGSVSVSRAAVQYNGWDFPPAIRATAEITPVMDDSGRSTKYLRLDLKVSFYLFHGLNLGTAGTSDSPDNSSNLHSGGYSPTSNYPTTVGNATLTTDAEMEFLQKRLTEPCQPLYFSSQGIGTVSVQDGESIHADVDNGPKPKITTWRPLTNKLCYVEWEISTCYSACGTTSKNVAQLPFSVEFSIDRKGLNTRTISGQIEYAATRTPGATTITTPGTGHAGVMPAFDFTDYRNQLVDLFPLLPGFWRDQNYTLSEDRKHVQFRLRDTEIDSDEAYGEGCVHEDVRIQVTNPIKKAFSVWDVQLSGSIELAAGYPKSFALAEISRLFNRYYTVCTRQGKELLRAGVTPQQAEQNEEQDPGSISAVTGESSNYKLRDSWAILNNINYTDHIFSRTVDFSISWMLFTTLKTLFDATGLFEPPRNFVPETPLPLAPGDAAEAQREQWTKWKTSLGLFLDNGGFQNLSFNQDDDIIVSLCQDLTGGGQTPQELNQPFDSSFNSTHDSPSNEPKNAWHSMEPRFDLKIDEHASYHAPLGDYTSHKETAHSPDHARELQDFGPPVPSGSSDDDTQNIQVHNHRQPSYLLEFSGYAIRLNYPVPEPNVESYGTYTDPADNTLKPMPIRRVGTTYLRPRVIGVGTDIETGKTMKIFGLVWHKTYALPAPPLDAKITTDAFKEIYGTA